MSAQQASSFLAGRVAWVTGGASGIGLAIVDALADAGANVAVLDRQAPPRDVPWAECDVASSQAVRTAAATLTERVGAADILINNAGIATAATVAETSDEEWEAVLRVNLFGAFYMTRAVLPAMVERRWGRIIFVSSGAAFQRLAGRGTYATSKLGLVALSRAVAIENARSGVTSNVLAPGVVDTPMARSTLTSDAEPDADRALAAAASANPMGVVMRPTDVAEAALFFVSPSADRLTGQVLQISGGNVMP